MAMTGSIIADAPIWAPPALIQLAIGVPTARLGMIDPSGMIDMLNAMISVSATWFVMINIPTARYVVIDAPATRLQIIIIRSTIRQCR